jgi:uncharacterized protein
MARTAETQDVQELLARGAQLLEVLPASVYELEHLPGAINIPLPELTTALAAPLVAAPPGGLRKGASVGATEMGASPSYAWRRLRSGLPTPGREVSVVRHMLSTTFGEAESGYNASMESRVSRNEEHRRYELEVDGHLVGVADYVVDGDVVVLPHTEIDRTRRGRGLGAILVQGALDDVRAQGRSVVPACWYVREYIDAHPDEADLLAP